MLPTDINTDVIVSILTIIIYIWKRYIEPGLPVNILSAVHTYAPFAAQEIEQVYGDEIQGPQKMTQAIQSVQCKLKAAGLPLTDEKVIRAAIESAVLFLPDTKKAPSSPS